MMVRMVERKHVTLRLSSEVHRAARLRAVNEGVSLQELGERWFSTYGAGGVVVPFEKETVELLRGMEAKPDQRRKA